MLRFGSRKVQAFAAAGVLAVTGVAGTVATVANAQQPTPTPGAARTATPSAGAQQRTQMAEEHLSRLAQNLGVSVDRLREALKQTALQEVDAALAAGRITAQQAQDAKTRINSGDFPGLHFGIGRGGPGGFGGRGFFFEKDQLAQFLGITEAQLQTELNGKSLAQVAQAHGKSRDQLIQFIVTSAQQRLAADVQAGRITQQQADQRLAELRERVGDMVDRVHQQGQRPQGTATPSSGSR
jgi:hypothetical protein